MKNLSEFIREGSIYLSRNPRGPSLRLVYEESESLYVMVSDASSEDKTRLQEIKLDDLTKEEQLLYAITSDNLPRVQALLLEGVDVKISHHTTVCQFQTKIHLMIMRGEYQAGFLAWALLLGNLEMAQVLINNGATLDANTAMQVMRMVFFRGDFAVLDFMLTLPNININMAPLILSDSSAAFSLEDSFSDDSYLDYDYLYVSKPLLHELCQIFSESLNFFPDSLNSLPDEFVKRAQYKKNILRSLPCLLKALLERKSDVNLADHSRKFPLDYIMDEYSIILLENLCDDAFQFLELLLENGINVNQVNFSRKTFMDKIVNSFLKNVHGKSHNPIDNFCRITRLLLRHNAVLTQKQQIKLLGLAIGDRIPGIMVLLQEECGVDIDENFPGYELTALGLSVQSLLEARLPADIKNTLGIVEFLIMMGANPHASGVPREIYSPYRERQLSRQELSVFTLLMRHAQIRTVCGEFWGDYAESEISQENAGNAKLTGKEEEKSSEISNEKEWGLEESSSHVDSINKSYFQWLPWELMPETAHFIRIDDQRVEKTVYRSQATALAKSMSASGIFNSASDQAIPAVATLPSFTP